MSLQQVNVGHVPEQDRLLVRISTTERLEYRFLLTRHLVKGLWGGLLKLMEHTEPVRQQAAPHSKAAVLGFQHEKALSESKFGDAYRADALTPALPGDPPLIVRINLSPGTDGQNKLVFIPGEGSGITVQFNERMLHAFSKLLRDASDRAGWDLALNLPTAVAPAGEKMN